MVNIEIFTASLVMGLWWLWYRLAIRFLQWATRDISEKEKRIANEAYRYGFHDAIRWIPIAMKANGMDRIEIIKSYVEQSITNRPYGGKP